MLCRRAATAFQVGVIHSIHEMTVTLVRLVKEIQTAKQQ
jgi:hypothetical protein